MNWTEYDEVAAEAEMGEFLYGFIRMLKPKLVVETGTYKGHTTMRLAEAITANQYGKLHSCDIQPGKFVTCQDPRQLLDVSFHLCSSLDLLELRDADFVFSDSDQNLRAAEYALVKPGCVFVVHDTHRTYSHLHDDPLWLGKWVESKGGIIFDAGRGFGLLKKK